VLKPFVLLGFQLQAVFLFGLEAFQGYGAAFSARGVSESLVVSVFANIVVFEIGLCIIGLP